MPTSKGGELFSINKRGKKVDAHIHDQILDNPEADAQINANYVQSLRESGYPEHVIKTAERHLKLNASRKPPKKAGGGEVDEEPDDRGPSEAEAARQAATRRVLQSVRPDAGRSEGNATRATEIAGKLAAYKLNSMAHLPQEVGEAATERSQGGDYDPAPFVNAAAALYGINAPFVGAGQAGIFGGQLAKTANLKKLEELDQMRWVPETFDPEKGLRQTRWYYGHEGMPKFEISDRGAKLTNLRKLRPDEAEFAQPEKFPEIPKKSAQYVRPAKDRTVLGEVLDHPELYQAYPHLRDIPVQFEAGTRGAWDPVSQEISVGAHPNYKTMIEALLHEVQHAVQQHESFSSGAAPSRFYPQSGRVAKMMANRIVGDLTFLMPSFEQKKIVNAINHRLFNMRLPSREALEANAIYKRLETHPQASKLLENLKPLVEGMKAADREAFSKYMHKAGEVEARNVTYRREKALGWWQPPWKSEGQHPMDKKVGFDPAKIHTEGDDMAGLNTGGSAAHSAMNIAKRYAAGGDTFFARSAFRQESRPVARPGMINSSIPGRTDKIPMKVKGGSYVIPSDVVSGLGQGNTFAGSNALDRLLRQGPYGMRPGKIGQPPRPNFGHPAGAPHSMRPIRPPRFEEGGEAPEEENNGTDIIAAGGEYLVDPEVVQRLGGGDMKHGHDILDAFVLHARKTTIDEMKNLKPPKKS